MFPKVYVSPIMYQLLTCFTLRASRSTLACETLFRIRHLDNNLITTLPGSLFANTLALNEL